MSALLPPYVEDEDLLARVRRDGRPLIRAVPAKGIRVVVGRGGDPEQEVYLERCREDGIPVLRRRGGGCAVVIDSGNLLLSLILPVEGLGGITTYFSSISRWTGSALERAGIGGVVQRGTSDLTIGDKKIGGSCIYRAKDLLYYSATLLVDADLSLLSRYLPHPPREPDYRNARAHDDFVMNLPGSQSPAAIAAYLASQPIDTLIKSPPTWREDC